MKLLSLKMIAILAATMAALFGVASPSHATSGWKWASDSNYGEQGMDVIGNGLTVSDVIMRYIPPNNDYLTGHAWRFAVSTYSCDPRGLTKSQCGVNRYFYGKLRTGNPPAAGSTCTTIGNDGGNIQWCQSYGAASAYASNGDIPTLTVPRTFSSGTWLCSEIEINSNNAGTGTWHFNGVGKGVRACAEVHS